MTDLKLEFVDSSMIKAFAYDEENQRLIALYTSGKWYVYGDFTKDDYENLMEAGSIGSYMRSMVIGLYPELSPREI
jgi:hypothetical protein